MIYLFIFIFLFYFNLHKSNFSCYSAGWELELEFRNNSEIWLFGFLRPFNCSNRFIKRGRGAHHFHSTPPPKTSLRPLLIAPSAPNIPALDSSRAPKSYSTSAVCLARPVTRALSLHCCLSPLPGPLPSRAQSLHCRHYQSRVPVVSPFQCRVPARLRSEP